MFKKKLGSSNFRTHYGRVEYACDTYDRSEEMHVHSCDCNTQTNQNNYYTLKQKWESTTSIMYETRLWELGCSAYSY